MVKLVTPSFKVVEDLIINFKLLSNNGSINENVLINSIANAFSSLISFKSVVVIF